MTAQVTPPSPELLAAMQRAVTPDEQAWAQANALATQPPPVAAPETPASPPPGPSAIPGGPYPAVFQPGAISANPAQAATGELAVNEGLAGSAQQAGEANEAALAEERAAHEAEAQRIKTQAEIEDRARLQANAEVQAEHQRHVDAYEEYRKKAASLKDPASQYWEDKGTPARIFAGLAAFSSGLGAGLVGQAGNPYLDFLNKEIDRNYNAHKQNINDLFDKQVAAGKIEDTAQNRAAFDAKARFAHYDMASQAIAEQLKAISTKALGANVRAMTDKTLGDLDRQNLGVMQEYWAGRQKVFAAQGAAEAAQLAADRKAYQEAYAKQPADVSDADKIRGTFAALAGLPGYTQKDLDRIARVVGTGALSTEPARLPQKSEAKDKEEKAQAERQGKATGYDNAIKALEEMQAIAANPTLDSAKTGRGEVLHAQLLESLGQIENGFKRAPGKETVEQLEREIGSGNPNDYNWGSSKKRAQIATKLEQMKKERDEFLEANGMAKPVPKKVPVASLPPVQ
jgi:hypothetical protein